jgi:hypothetical protein
MQPSGIFLMFSLASSWALFLATTLTAQTNPPAVEFSSLLNLRFYPQSGGFLVERLQLVFPPAAEQAMEFVIGRASGEAVATVPLRPEQWENFPAFRGLLPKGHPGNIQVAQPGDYVMAVKANDQAITQLSFKLQAEGGDDPFNPQKIFVLEGPWRSLAYLFVPVNEPEAPLAFRFWSCARELPADMKQAQWTVHLMRGNQEIAASRTKFVISWPTWQSSWCEFYSGSKIMTLAMLIAQDGDYKLVIKAKDKVLKSYALAVKGGKLQRLVRCDLNYQPHTNFISPRLVDTSSGSSSRYRMLEAYWVEAVKQ